jgi:hypothetical protein
LNAVLVHERGQRAVRAKDLCFSGHELTFAA